MSSVINTNVMSLNAQRNMLKSSGELATSMQRLSTGLRINSAKDDAAGLAISSRMTGQIRGMNQAVRNANDGISLVQTAEGALQTVSDNLQRIRELAVESTNSSNTADDRTALNTEAQSLLKEINRVAGQTQFNGQNLTDGTFGSGIFQVGANSGQTITVGSLTNATTSAIGKVYDATLSGSKNTTTAVAAGGTYKDPISGADATATDATTVYGGIAVQTDGTVTAVAAGTLKINGTDIGDIAQASSIEERVGQVVEAINNISGETGVTAYVEDNTIKLSSEKDITVTATDTATTDAKGAATTPTALSLTGFGAGATTTDGVTSAKLDATAAQSSALDGLNIDTYANANLAVRQIDEALKKINSDRASMGALQSRFESAVTNLETSSENLSSARSRIQDADFASETANLTRAQILQQAGVAMLSQANSAPQSVLSLLKG